MRGHSSDGASACNAIRPRSIRAGQRRRDASDSRPSPAGCSGEPEQVGTDGEPRLRARTLAHDVGPQFPDFAGRLQAGPTIKPGGCGCEHQRPQRAEIDSTRGHVQSKRAGRMSAPRPRDCRLEQRLAGRAPELQAGRPEVEEIPVPPQAQASSEALVASLAQRRGRRPVHEDLVRQRHAERRRSRCPIGPGNLDGCNRWDVARPEVRPDVDQFDIDPQLVQAALRDAQHDTDRALARRRPRRPGRQEVREARPAPGGPRSIDSLASTSASRSSEPRSQPLKSMLEPSRSGRRPEPLSCTASCSRCSTSWTCSSVHGPRPVLRSR